MENEVQLKLNKRNTVAFEQSLKELSIKIFDQSAQINNLNNTVAMLSQRLAEAEQMISILKALNTLRGPTVKE